MTFDEAFERVIGHEGGYVDNAHDPGGRTKYGISQRAYPGEDILGMTLTRAKFLYFRDYWGPAGCDSLPPEVRFDMFDLAVNSGVKGAIKLLQTVVGTAADGILGPKTLAAANSMPPLRLAARLSGARIEFIANLPDQWWQEFGRGLMRRIASNLKRI